VTLAAALSAGLALALAATPAASGEVTAAPATPQPARPAVSGGHDSAATLGPLAIGATVRDGAGAEIGRITRLTTDKHGRSVAEVRHGDDVYAIPVEALYARGGEAFSTLDLEALRGGKAR